MFGLVQDLVPGDEAVDGLALAYADEQQITNSNGDVVQYMLQVQVLPLPHSISTCVASGDVASASISLCVVIIDLDLHSPLMLASKMIDFHAGLLCWSSRCTMLLAAMML
jgi:hypothetical protein